MASSRLGVVYLHHFLADEKRALVSAVFLGKHPLRVGLLINDTKQVHSAVPNIAEHINAREARQVIDNGCEPLRVHLCAYDIDAVFYLAEGKYHIAVLKQIVLKSLLSARLPK